MNYKPTVIVPKIGGVLATDISAAEVGIQNYRTKRNWRRYRDREITREGHDYFWPDRTLVIGNQPLNSGAPIVQLFNAKSQNGKKAVIACTRTSIWRFFAEEDAAYVLDVDEFLYFEPYDVYSPYVETTGADTPYALESETPEPYVTGDYVQGGPSQWVKIADGLSASGKRWQIEQVGDTVIFNNTVDLPFSYNLSSQTVTPIYELREQGIASVGTILSFGEILLLADITQVKSGELAGLFEPIELFGTAEQAGTISSGTSYATQNLESNVVNIVSGSFVFDGSMTGQILRFINGFERTIVSVDSPTQVTLDGEPPHWDYPYVGNIKLRFDIVASDGSDSIVTSTNPVFDDSMVGLRLYWDNGAVRTIRSVIDNMHVEVDDDSPIASGVVTIDNTSAYAPVENSVILDRIRYRMMWSAVGKPTRFAASFNCSIEAGLKLLTLEYPVQSLVPGMAVTVVGAGINGGNQLTTIVTISGKKVFLSDAASTTVSDGLVSATDMEGSIVSYSDESADGSAIARMLDLNGQIVIYRETGYQIADYNPVKDPNTGDWQSIFSVSKFVGTPNTLFYPATLVQLTEGGVNYHIYAGKNNFYRFDMVTRQPTEFDPLRLCKNLFFDQMSALPLTVTVGSETFDKIDLAFSAVNEITKEVWVCFPSASFDFALCYDYEQATVSTIDFQVFSAATVKRPLSPSSQKEEDWFVMGTAAGQVLQYGRANVQQAAWSGGAVAIYNRLGSTYTATLQSGMGPFGYPDQEKKINKYFVGLSSFSPSTELTARVYGAVNQDAPESLMAEKTFSNPSSSNFMPLFGAAHFLSDTIVTTVDDSPCELSSRTFNIVLVRSSGVSKL